MRTCLTSENTLARYGIEYRNDLLGHFHALAPSAPPARYQTGHVPAEGQEDWPPNVVACREQRDLGATVGYTHPVWRPFSADGAPDSVFEPGVMGVRSVEARELVVDAALEWSTHSTCWATPTGRRRPSSTTTCSGAASGWLPRWVPMSSSRSPTA